MRVTLHEPKPVLEGVLDSSGKLMGVGRLPGLHLGALIKQKFYSGPSKNDFSTEQENARIALGFFWEKALEGAYVHLGFGTDYYRVWCAKQLTLRYERVALSPDSLYLGADRAELIDSKLTYYSRKPLIEAVDQGERALAVRMVERHEPWLFQGAAYIKGIREQFGLDVNVLHNDVFWVRGDYGKVFPTGPYVSRITTEFTDKEIESVWAEVEDLRDKWEETHENEQ